MVGVNVGLGLVDGVTLGEGEAVGAGVRVTWACILINFVKFWF